MTLLHVGVGSAGAFARFNLLRAIHAARRAGLHRLGASGLRLFAETVSGARITLLPP